MTTPSESNEVQVMDQNETSVPMISLTEAVTRWGSNKRIEGFEKLFMVKELKIRCQFKKGQSSSACGKEFTSSRDMKGLWKISNFSNHFRTHLNEKKSSPTGLDIYLLQGININAYLSILLMKNHITYFSAIRKWK